MLSIPSNLGFTQYIALHNDLILLASPLSFLTNDRICKMMTNVPLPRTLAGLGSLLCELGCNYVISFYFITRHNSLIITEGWVYCASTPVFFIEMPSLEGLPRMPSLKRIPLTMRWDYALWDINPVFPGVGETIIIIIIIIIIINGGLSLE